MAVRKKISPGDRRFLHLLSDATFTNPFSDERLEINAKIVGEAGDVSDGSAHASSTLLRETVSERISSLLSGGLGRLEDYSGEDSELLRTGFLFEVYHRYAEEFDRLILKQLDAGDRPVDIPFASAALGLLHERGFSDEEAEHLLALLFQIRRAYYFIDAALIGRSPCMKLLRRELWNSVFTYDLRIYERYLLNRMEDFSTMLLGETGTGKGTAAAAIGRSGFIPYDSKKGRFVESFTRTFLSINLSQFPEMLIESELFGHKKGAFTGAIEDHHGVFSLCSAHGAIFLDEVGDVSVPVQIKLLHVLQEREFSPVGARDTREFRGRVIAATNQPLSRLREQGRFRDDFYYRLCSHIITVPTLRQRLDEDPGELDELLEHLLVRMTGESQPALFEAVKGTIEEQLPNYEWSGNVRELEQCARRILLTNRYVPAEAHTASPEGFFRDLERGSLSAREVLSAYCALLYRRHATVAEVARRTGLDRRTVKKHVEQGEALLESMS